MQGKVKDAMFAKTCVFIIESVDSINRDERGFPLTQYITNWGISRARYIVILSEVILLLTYNNVSFFPPRSVWSMTDHLYDDYTRNWVGNIVCLSGMISIDGTPYRSMKVALF